MINIKKYSASKALDYIIRYKNNIYFYIIIIITFRIIYSLVKSNKYKKKNEPVLIYKERNIKPYIISGNKMVTSEEGIQFAYSFWIYMKNVSGGENWKQNYYEERNIFRKGECPIISYIPELNLFRIGIKTIKNQENIQKFDVKDVKFQDWVHFVVSVNNRTLDVFIDGELKNSFTIENVPILNDKALVLGSLKNKINGKITNLRYFNKSLDRHYVQKLYNFNKNKSIPNTSAFWWILT